MLVAVDVVVLLEVEDDAQESDVVEAVAQILGPDTDWGLVGWGEEWAEGPEGLH